MKALNPRKMNKREMTIADELREKYGADYQIAEIPSIGSKDKKIIVRRVKTQKGEGLEVVARGHTWRVAMERLAEVVMVERSKKTKRQKITTLAIASLITVALLVIAAYVR
jgi:hypothetical protein